jgi:hypothetical protein
MSQQSPLDTMSVIGLAVCGVVLVLFLSLYLTRGTPAPKRNAPSSPGAYFDPEGYRFVWTPPQQGSGPGYELYYAFVLRDPKGNVVAESKDTTDLAVAIPPPQTPGTYDLAVQATNQFGSSAWNTAQGTILAPVVITPLAPVIVYAPAGRRFSWGPPPNQPSNVNLYDFFVYGPDGKPIGTGSATDQNSFPLPAAAPTGSYECTVRARAPNGSVSPWSILKITLTKPSVKSIDATWDESTTSWKFGVLLDRPLAEADGPVLLTAGNAQSYMPLRTQDGQFSAIVRDKRMMTDTDRQVWTLQLPILFKPPSAQGWARGTAFNWVVAGAVGPNEYKGVVPGSEPSAPTPQFVDGAAYSRYYY